MLGVLDVCCCCCCCCCLGSSGGMSVLVHGEGELVALVGGLGWWWVGRGGLRLGCGINRRTIVGTDHFAQVHVHPVSQCSMDSDAQCL